MLKIFASVKDVNSEFGNTGDLFSFLLAENVLKGTSNTSGFKKLGVLDKAEIDANTYFLVGSILNQIPKCRGSVIYGPGMIDYSDNVSVLGNRLYGVRGFLTQEKIGRSGSLLPKVVSDPGLLLTKILPVEIPLVKEKKLGFVIHSVDRFIFFKKYPQFRHLLIDNYGNFADYIKRLANCELVVTSSLHGAVFCHSLGVRVAVISVSGLIKGGDFKFRDYYSSFGLDFDFMDFSGFNSSEDFIEGAASYTQPLSSCVENYKNMQLHDISYLLNSSYA